MDKYYALKGEDVVAFETIQELCEFEKLNGKKRHVADDSIVIDGETVRISTVLLMIDHNHFGGPPILFETMIFGGEHDMYQERYHSFKEAKEGHIEAVKMVKNLMVKDFDNGVES